MAKVALMTGASRGIGCGQPQKNLQRQAIRWLQTFCSSGQAGRSLPGADGSSRDARCCLCQADVSDPQQVEQMVQTVLRQFGHIDVLVCNAGIARQGLLTDFTPEDWRRMMAVNLDGTFYCCRSVLPSMIHRHSGSIITTSSILRCIDRQPPARCLILRQRRVLSV